MTISPRSWPLFLLVACTSRAPSSIVGRLPRFPYADDGVEPLELPYAQSRFAMTVVLPTAKNGLSAVEAALDAEHLKRWSGALGSQRVSVARPRFELSPADSLPWSTPLGGPDIELAFSDNAGLSGITPDPKGVNISEVCHKGLLATVEKGTEAATAMVMVMVMVMGIRGAARPARPLHPLVADDPSLFMNFMIRDTKSGLIMFKGRVVDPTADRERGAGTRQPARARG